MTFSILVTGAAGFIGRHLVQHTLDTTDYQITALVGLTYADAVDLLPRSPRLKLVYHDLRAAISDRLADQIGQSDFVVNLASESHVDRSITDPVPFALNNVQLILHILEFARKARPKKFFHLSTDEVFGPAPEGTSFGEWDAQLPSNPYAASKSAQDSLCVAYWRTYGLPLILGRTMNNYGAHQHPEKLFPKAARLLREGKPVPVHAEWTPEGWRSGSRTWLHATNTSDAILYLIQHLEPTFFPHTDRPEAVNISGDIEMTNEEVVRKIASIMGVTAILEYQDVHSQRPGHDRRYALNGTKLRDLGWTPPIDLETSFRDTVRTYQV